MLTVNHGLYYRVNHITEIQKEEGKKTPMTNTTKSISSTSLDQKKKKKRYKKKLLRLRQSLKSQDPSLKK